MNNRLREPDLTEIHLFLGVVENLHPGGRWIILTFDGKRVRAICFNYSQVWGVYITGETIEKEIDVIEKIRAEGKDEKVEMYSSFGSCPSLKITYGDWIQSAVECMKQVIDSMSSGEKHQVILLAEARVWASHSRIQNIYKKFGLDVDQIPADVLVEEVRKKGSRILSQGKRFNQPRVDADYYVHVVKSSGEEFNLTREVLFHKEQELAFSATKNKSSTLTVIPFLKGQQYVDLVLVKKNGEQEIPMSICRIRVENKNVRFFAQFDPVHNAPGLVVKSGGMCKPLEVPLSISQMKVEKDYRPLEIMAIVDATMAEPILETVKEKLGIMFRNIAQKRERSSFALVVYGDYSEHFKECEYDVKPLPNRFLDLKQWERLCEHELTRIEPADFMSALDRGLYTAKHFQWNPDAEKFMVMIFSKLPHLPQPYDFYNFTAASGSESWLFLLEEMIKEKEIHLFSIYLPGNVKGPFAGAIKNEISKLCEQLRKYGYLGEDTQTFKLVETGIIEKSVVEFKITPGTYQVPRLLETGE